MDMIQLLDSMKETIKLQSQARAERRAEEVQQERDKFQEKLMQAATGKMELDGMAAKIKGSEEAVRRDQFIGLIMAGL